MLSHPNQVLLILSFLLSSYSTLERDISECDLFTNQTNSTWKLVFEDQFDFAENLNETWILQNELTECHGNNLKPVTNCNLPRNAFTSQSGYLVLTSKYEKHLNYNFTGATLTSRATFGYGRLEIRAIQPIGDYLRTRIITRNTEEPTEAQYGQLNLGSSIVDGTLYRDILTVGTTANADIQLDQLEPKVDLHGGFHVYGAEWNEEGVIFFFDDSYSQPIKYNVSTGLTPPHQIQLQMGVGGRDFDRPDAIDHFEDLDWQCPAFIIDYVRVYRRVTSETLGGCLVDWATRNETEIADETLDQICDLALVGNEVPFSLYLGKYWRPIIFGSLGLFLLFFIGYLIMLIIQMRRKINSDPFSTLTNPADDEDDNTYETIIYDEPSALKNPNPENQYLKLYDDNQYLQLSDVDEKYLKLYDLKVHEYLAITGSVDEISKKVPEYSANHTKKMINNKLALMKKKSLSDGQIYLPEEGEQYRKYLTMTPSRKSKAYRNGLKNYEPLIV